MKVFVIVAAWAVTALASDLGGDAPVGPGDVSSARGSVSPGDVSALAAAASADAAPRGDRDGGAAEVPRGPDVRLATPPAGSFAWPRVCSTRHRFCVHAHPGSVGGAVLACVDAVDGAWATLTESLGMPPPSGIAGEPWAVYLVDGVAGGGDAVLGDRAFLSTFDAGSTFGLLDRRLPSGCGLDRAAAYAVARAALWSASPAADDGTARAETAAFARLAASCLDSSGDEAAFQSSPSRSIADPSSAPYDRGAALFYEWLDARFGARPGALVAGLSALSPTHTPGPSWDAGFWSGSPTVFDVLRVSLRDALWAGSRLEDIFTEFAVARAHAVPAPAVSWHVPWPDRPRRLASPEPVAPAGASYVVVDRRGAPRGSRLRLEAAWEDYARMRWVAVKVDAAGHFVAQLPIASADRATHASLTVEGLDDVDRVMVIGVNVGDTDHSFDPDQRRWEPHGWLLTVAGESD